MKVTPNTPDASATLYHAIKEASIEYNPYSSDSVARVIEFPKVWRFGGTQYKVTSCAYRHNGDWSDKVKVRVPYDAYDFISSCDYTVERY